MNVHERALQVRLAACDPLALVEALSIPGPRKRQPRGLLICCPAHKDLSPSCSVRVGTDGTLQVKCHACGFGADAIGLVQRVRGYNFVEALRELAAIAGLPELVAEPYPLVPAREDERLTPPVDRESFAAIVEALAELCPLASARDVSAYVAARNIHADAIAIGTIGLPRRQDQGAVVEALVARFGHGPLEAVGLVDGRLFRDPDHRLGLVWRDRGGRATTLQRRVIVGNRRDKYRVTTGIPFDVLFGSELFDDALGFLGDVPIIVTEGAIDCLARRKIARLQDEHVIVLGAPSVSIQRPEWREFFDGRHVIVAFDADAAGDAGAQRFIDTCCAGARAIERERPIFNAAKDWCDVLAHFVAWRAQP